jgi:tRNA A-37 threonylcarbamoyl transferase component Bud32
MTTGDETARIYADRYVLGDQLTAGASREVWRAHDDLVSRAVVLKIFFGDQAKDPQWRARFGHGARRLAALSHPGIARLLDHGENGDETWLVTAYVEGVPLSHAVNAASAAELFDAAGQAALALRAAHDAGISHGALGPDAVMVRADGSAALIGFEPATDASQADDLRALAALFTACATAARSTEALPPDVEGFVKSLSDADAGTSRDAGDIGRSALALATSLRGGPAMPTATATTGSALPPRASWRRQETPEQEASRKQVRNRLIVLGTIVVVGGGALLRFVGKGGGDVTVPPVIGQPVNQAALALTRAGLREVEACAPGKDSGNTIVSQLPPAGQRVKAGSVVVVTVRAATCP